MFRPQIPQNPIDFGSLQNFAKKARRAGLFLGLLLIVAVLALGSFYSIGEQEQAVVITFGAPTAVTTPGLHFKVPFLQNVRKVSTTINGFAIGYNQDTGEPIPDESLMITSDYNFVNVDFFVEYRVVDPIKALYASENPVMILKMMAQNYIRDTIGVYTVDETITTGKNEIQAEIREKLTSRLLTDDLGISLVNITIQDAEPPTREVLEAFKNVETAKQGKETLINTARKYQSEQLPAAEAQADSILKSAEGKRQSRINEANGQTARFNAIYDEYVKFPEITRQRMFFEAMEDILPDLRVIIDDKNSATQKLYPLGSFTGGEGGQ